MSFWTILITTYLSVGIFAAGYGLSRVSEPNANMSTFPGMIVFVGIMFLWPFLLTSFAYSVFNTSRTTRINPDNRFTPPTQRQINEGAQLLREFYATQGTSQGTREIVDE